MTDLAIFDALSETVPPEYRAECYLRKQMRLAESELQTIERLIEEQTPLPRDEVARRARALRTIVYQIGMYATDRGPQPFPDESGRRVANVLVDLIEHVIQLDHDVRPSGRPHSKNSRFNLYSFLIGDPISESSNEPNWMRDIFVLDLLESFPFEHWQHLVVRLHDIRDRIAGKRQSDRGNLTFCSKIDEFLRAHQRRSQHAPSNSPVVSQT